MASVLETAAFVGGGRRQRQIGRAEGVSVGVIRRHVGRVRAGDVRDREIRWREGSESRPSNPDLRLVDGD
jgi:hypothetical protein